MALVVKKITHLKVCCPLHCLQMSTRIILRGEKKERERSFFYKGENLPLVMPNASFHIIYSAVCFSGQEIPGDMFSIVVCSIRFATHSARCNARFFLWIISFAHHNYPITQEPQFLSILMKLRLQSSLPTSYSK